MGPVDDVGLVFFIDDDIGRVEVAVAQTVVSGHPFDAVVQIIAQRRGKVGLRDLAVHLVAVLVEQRASLRLHLDLQVDKAPQIFIFLFRLFIQHLLQRPAFDEAGDDRPAAIDDPDFQKTGDAETGLFDPRLIQRFV